MSMRVDSHSLTRR